MGNRALVEQYIEAANAEDWDVLSGFFGPSSRVKSVGLRAAQGTDEILRHYKRLFRSFRHHHDTILRIVEVHDTAIAWIEFSGTTTQNVAVKFEAIDIFDFEEGVIVQLTNWFDTADVYRQMGISP